MFRLRLNLQIEEPFAGSVSERWIRRVARMALMEADIRGSVEIGVVIAGDTTVRELNRTYRGKDSTTDVLSFALQEGNGGDRFVTPPGRTARLGEVIISLPQAEKQAAERNHSLRRELALLMVHGVLHLLSYDHEEEADEKRMRALENRVLGILQE